MKTYRIILPEFLLEFNYKLKNENVILLTSLGYEQRGLLYKEYYFDKYNQFESIEYIYSYLKFRLGICYEVGSFSFIGCVNIGSKINSNVKYNLKGGGSYSSPHPVFNSLLSTKITPEINIRYSILKKSSLNPQINFGIEPLLNGTKVYSFSLGIICSII